MCSASVEPRAELLYAVVDRHRLAGNSSPEPHHQAQDQPPRHYDIGQEMSAEDNPVEGNEEQDRNCDHSSDGSPLQGNEDDKRQGCGGYRGLARGKGATVPASGRILPYGRKIGGSTEFDDFARTSSSNGVLQKLYWASGPTKKLSSTNRALCGGQKENLRGKKAYKPVESSIKGKR